MLTIRPIDAPVRENGYKGEQGPTTRDAGDEISYPVLLACTYAMREVEMTVYSPERRREAEKGIQSRIWTVPHEEQRPPARKPVRQKVGSTLSIQSM